MDEEKFWYIRQLGDEKEARNLFEWCLRNRDPALLFWNTFMSDYLLAAYADDAAHQRASRDVEMRSIGDGYIGEIRLKECFLYHILLAYANLEIVSIVDRLW